MSNRNRNHQSNSSPSPEVQEEVEKTQPEKTGLIEEKPEVLDPVAEALFLVFIKGSEEQKLNLIAYLRGTMQAAKEPKPTAYDKDLKKLKRILNGA